MTDVYAWFNTDSPAKITFSPQDSTYNELSTAPSDTTVYHNVAAVLSYGVYVVRTKELHYAKFWIRQIGGGGITIEYTYQDNGTKVLVEPVAGRPATWGRVKSMYR